MIKEKAKCVLLSVLALTALNLFPTVINFRSWYNLSLWMIIITMHVTNNKKKLVQVNLNCNL